MNYLPGIGSPAADPNVFSVGSTITSDIGQWRYHNTTGTDHISYYSQRHKDLLDVFAPGTMIYSSVHAFDLDNDGYNETYAPNSYDWYPGTSMASPQVAGFAAVAQQAALEYLGRKLSVDELSKIVTDNADTIYDGDDEDDPINDGFHTEAYYKRINF